MKFLEFLCTLLFVIVLLGFLTIITLQLAMIINQLQFKVVEQPVPPQTQQQGDDAPADEVPVPRFDQTLPFPV